MQFIKSLFCLQGFDNRSRFFTIYSTIFILFIILTPIFSNNIILYIVSITLLTLVLSFSVLRRLNDAKLDKKWLLAPTLTFIIVATVIVFTDFNNNYYLLIIPILSSAALLTYRSSRQLNYILGYFGPIDMSEYQAENDQCINSKLRIEPTVINTPLDIDDTFQSTTQQHEALNNSDEYKLDERNRAKIKQKSDLGEIIRLQLLNNKKVQFILLGIVGITLIIVIVFQLVEYLNKPNVRLRQDNLTQQFGNTKKISQRNNPLPMPDNYTLYLSKDNGLIINWIADEVQQSTLWSQKTAKGDVSCQAISFDKGESIRTLLVQVEHTDINGTNSNTSYYANFSPLDSEVLIKALAFRNNFALCGYHFSLKGSQAVLGTNEQYGQWLNN